MANYFDQFDEPAGPPAPKAGGNFFDQYDPPKAPGEDVTAGMALRGIPVLGAYVPQAEAAIRAAAQPLTGVGQPGATYAERYAKNLPLRQADYAQAEREQPIASTALQIGGGAAALAPVGATALGARALGATGPMLARIPLGAASGAGIAAADAAARGEDIGTAAGIAGGVGAALPVIGGTIGRIGQVARSFRGAPISDELGAATDAGYTALRGSGLKIKPQAVQSAINQIRINQQIHPKLTPEVSGLLENAATKGIMSPLTARSAGASFDDIDTLRKQLGAVARNFNNPTEQEAARDAIRGLDDYLAKIPPADVLSGNAAQVSALAKETRANAAAEFRTRALDALRTRAEDQAASAGSGLNVENAYRQQLRAFIRPNNRGVSPASKEGFNESEINRMRAATHATSFPNVLRLLGNVLGGGSGLIAAGAAGTSLATGDPRYLAAAGAGYGLRRLSNAMMRNRAEMLGRMAAARSPLAQQMGVGGPGLPLNVGPAQAGLLGLTQGLLPYPGMAEGGRPDGPTWVGEQGPELFVPDRPGTVVPGSPQRPFRPGEREQYYVDAINGPQGYPDFNWVNPAGVDAMLAHSPESKNVEDWRDYMGGFGAAAQRMARAVKPPGGRQEGAGTKFVEGGYGVPSLYKMLDEGAQRAFESAGSLQRGGSYDPGPVVMQALGAVGAPMVAPAMEGAVLGAGAIRRAAIPQAAKQALKEAPYPQYATEYPPTAPPVLKTDPKSGKEYLGKVASPEAEQFMKTREGVIADMKQGYEPYYDPAQRTLVDPSKYPGRNVDTLTIQPARQETVDKYLKEIDAPITRERLRKAFERGNELGNADNWYFMGQLEKDFVKELGAKEGRKQFLDRFASGMAATTSGNNPTTNLLMSHYLNYLTERGLPMPTAGHQLPSPVGGRYGMSNVEDYMRMRQAGGYTGLGADQPKMHNFARSFIGDLDRAVMDDQMAKGMVGHVADPNFADRARKQAFGLLEQPLHAEAAAAGVRPGAYQDVAWAGFKNEPGKPMISHINDAIERTHRLTGMSRDEIVRRGLIRNEIPLYGFSVPMPTLDRRE